MGVFFFPSCTSHGFEGRAPAHTPEYALGGASYVYCTVECGDGLILNERCGYCGEAGQS